MWSHYAYKHQGVCLKFDVLKDINFFFAGGSKSIGLIRNVEYCNKYPLISVYNAMIEKSVTRELPFLKLIDWIYEKEFRIISNELDTIPLGIRFNKEALIEVNFGCRINESRKSKKRKSKLIKILKKAHYPNIIFYEAKTSKDKFELVFEEVHI